MNKKLALLLCLIMVFTLTVFTACGGGNDDQSTADTEATEEAVEETAEDVADTAEEVADAAAYGYTGSDPIEAAVYEYVGDELSEGYSEGQYSVPEVNIIATDTSNDQDILVWGDFWIFNYDLEGDTLMTVSGGNHPGLIHLKKDGDEYEVVKMDTVADGENFMSSAEEIFGEHYDAFMVANTDDAGKEAIRLESLANFVKANNLPATKYQDYGWDPVDLPLE
ncbi:MAG: hypothetical protein IKE85_07800 [Mogibacterium sp.]|nr:hypothetical protein [Mogibacterium sp.]